MLDGHSAVVWQGDIYVWGGKDETSPSASRPVQSFYSSALFVINCLEALNPSSVSVNMRRISTGATVGDEIGAPRGRAYHTATMFGKYMCIIGGLMDESATAAGPGAAQDINNNVVVPFFDMEARAWSFRSTFGDVPCARCHHVAVTYGDCIMVHGGYPILPGGQQRELTAEEMASMQHAMFDVHELNVSTLRWRRISTAQSPALWGHSAVAFNKNVIVFGGVDVVENTETGAVAVWHQEKKLWRWADFQNLELKCAMHTAVVDGSRMLVYSGVSFKSQKKLRTLFEFNLEFGTWRELQPRGQIPLGRIGHATVVFQQHMLVIGGASEATDSGAAGSGDLSSATARFDQRVYVYNTQTNEWRSLGIVTSADLPEGDTSRGAGAAASGRLNPTGAWSINKSTTGQGGSAADDAGEWQNTASRVRETLSRAKAIQQLADAATSALQTSAGDDRGAAAAHARDDDRGSPGGGASAAASRLQRQAAPGTPFEVYGGAGGTAAPSAATQEEARRVIEHLAKENERLRQQLEEFRSLSLTQQQSNPYEVPVFNTAALVLREQESLTSPGRARDAARMDGSAALAELAPRLNINVAEPPRSVGAGATGFMSRSAVSALVNSSLRDQPASVSLAANLRASASLDPMSYLTQTPHVAAAYNNSFAQAAIPGSFQAPRSYEQLLSRSNLSTSSNASLPVLPGGLPTTADAPPIPNSLKPLLALLTGGNFPGTGIPSSAPGSGAAAGIAPFPQAMDYANGSTRNAAAAAASPSPLVAHQGVHAMAAWAQQQAASQAVEHTAMQHSSVGRPRTPSLSKLVQGQGSMLSLSLLK